MGNASSGGARLEVHALDLPGRKDSGQDRTPYLLNRRLLTLTWVIAGLILVMALPIGWSLVGAALAWWRG
jgi:hypothetical protein